MVNELEELLWGKVVHGKDMSDILKDVPPCELVEMLVGISRSVGRDELILRRDELEKFMIKHAEAYLEKK